MIGRLWLAALAAGMCVSSAAAQDAAIHGQMHVPFVMKGATPAPIGARQFCRTWPEECGPITAPSAPVILTKSLWRELVAVNRAWNRRIVPQTDEALYKVTELWTYPDGAGDCEDFALAKRRDLIERGWPASALLMALVRQQNGDGHAVLVALTNEGDLVLDNLVSAVTDWDQTSYQFIKVSSPASLADWVAVEDPRTLWVATR